MSTPTISQEYVWRWQCDPTWSATGQLVASPLHVFYRKDLNPGDGSPSTTIQSQPTVTIIDMVANANKTIDYNGRTYTYIELVEAMSAMADHERVQQLAGQ